jgi:hypothetical protein
MNRTPISTKTVTLPMIIHLRKPLLGAAEACSKARLGAGLYEYSPHAFYGFDNDAILLSAQHSLPFFPMKTLYLSSGRLPDIVPDYPSLTPRKKTTHRHTFFREYIYQYLLHDTLYG